MRLLLGARWVQLRDSRAAPAFRHAVARSSMPLCSGNARLLPLDTTSFNRDLHLRDRCAAELPESRLPVCTGPEVSVEWKETKDEEDVFELFQLVCRQPQESMMETFLNTTRLAAWGWICKEQKV